MSPGLDRGRWGAPPQDPIVPGPRPLGSPPQPGFAQPRPRNGRGGGAVRPGWTQGRVPKSPEQPLGRGPRRPGSPEGGDRAPRRRQCRGSLASPRGRCRCSAHTNNNKRKETGRQRSPHRVLHVGDASGGWGWARREDTPSGVPPQGPPSTPGASLAPTFEVRNDPVQLRVDRGVRHGGARAARRADGGGAEAPCAARALRPRSRPGAALAAEPLGPRAPLNEWGRRRAPASRAPRPGPAPGRIGFPHRPGLPPGSHWLLRPPVKARAWGAGTRAGAAGPAESWAPDPSAPLLRAWLVPRGRPRTRPAPPPRTPRCGQMWADVGAGRRHGGGAEAGRDSSPSLGLRAPSAGGFIYGAKQSWPPPPPSRAQRLQGLSAGAGGPQEPGLLAKSRGASAGVTWPGARGWGTPPATPRPHPSVPGSLLHSLGWVTEKALAHGHVGQRGSAPVRTARAGHHPCPPQEVASGRQSVDLG